MTAITWTARVAVDALAIGWMASRLGGGQAWLSWPLAGVMLAAVAALPLVAMPADVAGRILVAGVAAVVFPLAAMRLAGAR